LGWSGNLIFATLFAGGMGAQFLLLAVFNPKLLDERTTIATNTKRWDKVLMPLIVLILPVMALAVAGLDLRYGWRRPFPVWTQIAGAVVGVSFYGLTLNAMVKNRFFSAVVRIQSERGHQVQSSGPYRWIRHPGYLGILGFLCSIPAILGSRVAIFPTALAVALHLWRTALEDRFLLEELPGYRQYSSRVRYRLIPGIW
jgi:protein-S-isoprenylcysteine O-methyltransferase Ste14